MDGTVFLLSILLVLSGVLLCLLVQAVFFFTPGRAARRLHIASLPALLAALDECVLLVDKKGQIAEANPAFTRTFPAFSLKTGETPLLDFCHFLGAETLTDGELTQGGQTYLICLRQLAGGGAVYLIRDISGQRDTLLYFDSLTKRFALLQRQMHVIAGAVETENAARHEADKAAQRAQAASRHFLAGLARAIRQPANALQGANVRQTQAATRQLLDIADDVQDMTAFETGTFALRGANFDFGSMLAQLAGTAQVILLAKQGELRVEIADDVPAYLHADEARLARLLASLLLCAAEASPKKEKLCLSVRSLATEDETCTLIFQLQTGGPLAQSPAAERLAVPRRLARAMGGALSLGISPKSGLLLALTVQVKQGDLPKEDVPAKEYTKEDPSEKKLEEEPVAEQSKEKLPDNEPDENKEPEGGQNHAHTP